MRSALVILDHSSPKRKH